MQKYYFDRSNARATSWVNSGFNELTSSVVAGMKKAPSKRLMLVMHSSDFSDTHHFAVPKELCQTPISSPVDFHAFQNSLNIFGSPVATLFISGGGNPETSFGLHSSEINKKGSYVHFYRFPVLDSNGPLQNALVALCDQWTDSSPPHWSRLYRNWEVEMQKFLANALLLASSSQDLNNFVKSKLRSSPFGQSYSTAKTQMGLLGNDAATLDAAKHLLCQISLQEAAKVKEVADPRPLIAAMELLRGRCA